MAADQAVYSCVDLFSGAGGFSLAARNAGLSVRLAVEMNRSAAASYKDNLCQGSEPPLLKVGDIRTMHPGSIFSEAFAAGQHCDLLLGGPPCQGFSSHRLNDAGVADTRNDLIHTYFDFVRAFAPSVFLMENVPGMLWERHKPGLKRFYEEGNAAGYLVHDPVVLDARDYGIPQRRKRVFILGVRKSFAERQTDWPPQPSHGNEARRKLNADLLPWRDCAFAFLPARHGDINDVHMHHSAELTDAFSKTPPNGGSRHESGRVLPCHQKHDGHNDVYGRIDPHQPAPTMTTACINPSKGRFVHPTLHHGITVRQAARIQTFPDNFRFHGGLMAAGEQVGNAVPVLLGELLIRHLLPLLSRANVLRARQSKTSHRELA